MLARVPFFRETSCTGLISTSVIASSFRLKFENVFVFASETIRRIKPFVQYCGTIEEGIQPDFPGKSSVCGKRLQGKA